jgi:hypothetical protein
MFCDVPCIVCVYMCTEQLPSGGYPIAVKYIISCNVISLAKYVHKIYKQNIVKRKYTRYIYFMIRYNTTGMSRLKVKYVLYFYTAVLVQCPVWPFFAVP